PKRILIVDDEELNRELMEAMMASFGHVSELAIDGPEALEKMTPDFDLVLLDVMMPGMDGFEVARRIRENPEINDIPIIMITGLSSQKDRLQAVKAGVNDFISKPVDRVELNVRTDSMLKMKEAQDEIKQHRAMLEETVEKRTASLRKTLKELRKAQRLTHQAHLDTIRRLAVASEYRDEDTALHINRMSNYCAIVARGLSLSADEVDLILHASPMHDVGKIGIPDAILLKPGKLDNSEWEIMKQHSIIGARILRGSSSELVLFEAGEIIALAHHEKWNGTGYPKGLSGEDIPLYGRICAIADIFDALTSNRPYKKAFSSDKALEILQEGRGTHVDPNVVDVFFDQLDDVVEVQKKYTENEEEKRRGVPSNL
ncbi:MAG: response regulator, partial [Desulfobacteraceae bacterium]|nr:response regulator [Desulfobacteraceae bacterium]